MSARVLRTSAVGAGTTAAALIVTSAAMGFGGNGGTVCPQPVGPDVIVGDMQGTFNTTAENISGVMYDAFSFGTVSCNIGNQNLQWYAFSNGTMSLRNKHPAIAQGLYRYKVVNGAARFEMIGQSWLKHGFTALTQNLCGCGCNGSGGTVLGVGCSDPYTAQRNASQSTLGPKWQVDASSGYFPTASPANPAWGGTTARRLRVKSSDLEISTASVRHFGETQYVSQDDAAYGNKNNNASYRECFLTGGPNDFSMSINAGVPTVREQPAIMAWKAIDPNVTITHIETPETPNPNATLYPPNPACCSTGLVIVGAKATQVGDCLWNYEYAVQNLNSHNSIASFSIPLEGPIQISDIGFHDVDYHSLDGENSVTRDGTDWTPTVTSTSITWETQSFATNPNANAIRWGTTYNFRFRANSPPTTGLAKLGTYRVVGEVIGDTVIPTPVDPPTCPPDVTGDSLVNANDLLAVINAWGACKPSGACKECPADVTTDGSVNANDLLAVINAWGPCPSGFTDSSDQAPQISRK